MAPVFNRALSTHQRVVFPGHHVRLTRGNRQLAAWTGIGFLRIFLANWLHGVAAPALGLCPAYPGAGPVKIERLIVAVSVFFVTTWHGLVPIVFFGVLPGGTG